MPEQLLTLVGDSYKSRSSQLSSQSTINWYPELVPSGQSNAALMCWPGAKPFSIGSGESRGMFFWRSYVYVICGQDLVKVNAQGSREVLGNILGSSRCVFAGASYWLYIVTGGLVYRTNGTAIEQVSDIDLETPNSAAFINSRIIFDGDDGRFMVSSAGDGSVIDSLDFATAEAVSDELIRVYVFKQNVFMMGANSIEPWYNSQSTNPPMDRIDAGISYIGIAGVYAVTHTPNAVYFLGNDRVCYAMAAYDPQPISTSAISNELEGYASISDAFCFSLRLQGQNIVVFSFPSADKTWCFSESTGLWFQISTGLKGGRHLANDYCYAFGKHLVCDYRNGNVYEWSLNQYSDNGEIIIRERVLQPVVSDFVSNPGETLFWNSLELFVNSGNGLAFGQGKEPVVMLSYSDDAGKTWAEHSYWRSTGELGAYSWSVLWHSLGSSKNRVFKIRISDPVECHLFKLKAEYEVGV